MILVNTDAMRTSMVAPRASVKPNCLEQRRNAGGCRLRQKGLAAAAEALAAAYARLDRGSLQLSGEESVTPSATSLAIHLHMCRTGCMASWAKPMRGPL